MTKERLESILAEYGVPLTDALADRLLKEFTPLDGEYIKKIKEKCDSINEISEYQLAYGEVREIQESLNEILEIVKTLVPKKGEFEGMTNGEVFQKIFPCEEIHINGLQDGIVHFSMTSNLKSMDCFSLEWWNAPYQKGGE